MILPPGINLLNYGWKEMPGVIIFCNLKVEEYIILISFIISSSSFYKYNIMTTLKMRITLYLFFCFHFQ